MLLRTLLILLLPAFAFAQQPAPKDSPELARAKELAAYTPRFTEPLFTTERFPEVRPSPTGTAVEVTFYNRNYDKVTEAKEKGPYIAVCEVISPDGVKSKRYVPIARIGEVKKDLKGAEGALEAIGIPLEAVARNQPLWSKQPEKDILTHAWSRNPALARLAVAMLLDDGKGKYPAHKYDDALALERQWVLGLKRRLNGWDKQFPKPVLIPHLTESYAPIVRDGKPENAGFHPDAAAKIDAALTRWAGDTDQAFAVCIVRKGVIVLHKAYGTRDDQPMSVDTKSWMASVTKTMSATLLMMLVDRDLVGLDDDLSKYFPALKGIEVKKPLKVRNLLNHTGGLAAFPMIDDPQDDAEERLANAYAQLKVGEQWAYGGTGNTLAGRIVEAVTGKCVPIAFHEYLLEPLGMKHTDVAGCHADSYSVPLDMAKFGQMLLNRGSYGTSRFLKPGTFELMLPRKLTTELGPDAVKTFGLGLDGAPNRFGHGAASAAQFSVNVDDQLVVIMTRNKMGKNDEKYNGPFHDAIRAGLVK
jgi:CubicO group peptidase (beta-lactamase class C family)